MTLSQSERFTLKLATVAIAVCLLVFAIALKAGGQSRAERLQSRIEECRAKQGIVMEDGAGWTVCIIQGTQLRLNAH